MEPIMIRAAARRPNAHTFQNGSAAATVDVVGRNRQLDDLLRNNDVRAMGAGKPREAPIEAS